jgi:hypothetical protein
MSDREEFRDRFSLHLLRRESQTSDSFRLSLLRQDPCKFYNVSVAVADEMKQSWRKFKRAGFFLLESCACKQ